MRFDCSLDWLIDRLLLLLLLLLLFRLFYSAKFINKKPANALTQRLRRIQRLLIVFGGRRSCVTQPQCSSIQQIDWLTLISCERKTFVAVRCRSHCVRAWANSVRPLIYSTVERKPALDHITNYGPLASVFCQRAGYAARSNKQTLSVSSPVSVLLHGCPALFSAVFPPTKTYTKRRGFRPAARLHSTNSF